MNEENRIVLNYDHICQYELCRITYRSNKTTSKFCCGRHRSLQWQLNKTREKLLHLLEGGGIVSSEEGKKVSDDLIDGKRETILESMNRVVEQDNHPEPIKSTLAPLRVLPELSVRVSQVDIATWCHLCSWYMDFDINPLMNWWIPGRYKHHLEKNHCHLSERDIELYVIDLTRVLRDWQTDHSIQVYGSSDCLSRFRNSYIKKILP